MGLLRLRIGRVRTKKEKFAAKMSKQFSVDPAKKAGAGDNTAAKNWGEGELQEGGSLPCLSAEYWSLEKKKEIVCWMFISIWAANVERLENIKTRIASSFEVRFDFWITSLLRKHQVTWLHVYSSISTSWVHAIRSSVLLFVVLWMDIILDNWTFHLFDIINTSSNAQHVIS